MKVTKLLAFVLALTMVFALVPVAGAAHEFKRVNANSGKVFPDITQEDWFFPNVTDAFELGLMKGQANGRFNPSGNITLAETITIAARIHAIATNGEEAFVQGTPWYKVYADYALANGIITEEPEDYAQPATRVEFAEILALALSADDLSAINTVEDGAIPDVKDNAAIYKLYRAGVLGGNDEAGTFLPESCIKRSEVSAIVVRMALPETRIKRDLKKTVAKTEDKKTTNVSSMAGGGSSSGSKPQKPQEPPKSEISATVEVDDEGKVKNEVSMSGDKVNATVPAGVAVNEGADKLTLKVEEMEETGGNIELGEDETLSSYDVHIDGISSENTVAVKVFLGEILPVGMNLGNITLYHIENEETNAMTQVATLDELDAHNEFYYDPATGNVTVALASFSEIAVVAEPPKWNGNRDYSWYRSANETNYTIANADQLAGLSAIVGGMAEGIECDSFSGKTVKMVCDIAINDTIDSETDEIVFYPIGYYNSEGTYTKDPNATTGVTSGFRNFEGTFDGNGHTISDFYQNTWEMKGDHDWYNENLQYYRDGMGVFGKVYKGTVKNLTVKNFSSDGEIATTGVIAAYADGATFENIAIFNCNPRVYNIGNGGIVGCVGWYAKEADLKTTFKNITVDNSNKISALWGSYDVACGGLVGQYYPTSGQTSAGTPKNGGIHMENCHVSAQMDVYNDVCANYQYYAYRYAGILIGSVRENETIDGHSYPKMDGITASGCTVHFGDWNDYYYCELVANSLASYTHDHQMSRLEQVLSVDVENKKITPLVGEAYDIPTDGRYNYVVVKAEDDGKWIHGDGHDFAECYHFVNGVQHKHDVADSDNPDVYETVGDETVLKEDKQLIYREFNNLVTGYGWGVTSKGVEDVDGVTILDREEGNSVTKFEGKGVAEIESNRPIKLGDLFTYIENEKVDLQFEQLAVAVSDLNDADGIATGTFTKGATWEDSTITVHGKGRISITIQDYYFCAPTTITLYAIDPMSSLTVYATTLYEAGQNFNVNSVFVNYKWGTSRQLSADEYRISAYDFSTAGLKSVTISYSEFGHTVTQKVSVEVTDALNGLIASPKKSTYAKNYEFTTADFNVTAVDSNGKAQAVSGYDISAVDTSTTGKKIVTISITNPTTGKVTATACEVLIFNLKNISDQVEQYWFFDGNFNVSGWANVVHGDVHTYDYYIGQTYIAPNGETVTGFDDSWAEPPTKANNGATATGQTAIMSEGKYDLVINDALPYTTLGINCIAGYSEPLLGFGYYVDGDLSTLQYNSPAIIYDESNAGGKDLAGYTLLDYLGPNNGHSLLEMNCNKFAPGSTHTVYWVAVFADGVKNISEWKVNMKAAEQSDLAYVDTEKPDVNVIIMAGQSNMFGASPITQVIRDKYQNHNFSNVYIRYNNINFDVNPDGTMPGTMSTYFSNDKFQKYQLGIGGQGDSYFGPEATLAYHLSTTEGFKDKQWYIIKYAPAGTVLGSQWLSTCTVNGQKTTLTDDMLAYIQENITALENDGFDVKIHSFMWMQGESDAIDATLAQNYGDNEKILVSRVRNAFAGNATRYVGDQSVPGGGMAFINATIATNDIGTSTANGGPNDWIYAEIVNAGKLANSQQLCSVPGHNSAMVGEVLQTGPMAGHKFTVINNGAEEPVPTIVNPNRENAIINSILLDTHHLLSKLNSTDEHGEYSEGDKTDWAHYGAASMRALGELFASANHYMAITGPIMSETKKYTVSFNANSGEVTPASETNSTVTLPTPTREGYTFNGWYDAASGGTKIGDAGASYKPEKDITLYAQWTKATYSITVNGSVSGVSYEINKETASMGDEITLTFSATSFGFNSYSVTVTYEGVEGKTSETIKNISYFSSKKASFTMPANDVTVTISK